MYFFIKHRIDRLIAHYIFRNVKKDGAIVIGPELMTGFELRHPERIQIGNKTVIPGNCFINAMGG